jgi:hypothetical protein
VEPIADACGLVLTPEFLGEMQEARDRASARTTDANANLRFGIPGPLW